MPTVNELLQDAAIEHAIDLQRYSAAAVAKIIALLNRADADLAAQLAVALELLEGTPYSTERIAASLASVDDLIRQVYAQMGVELAAELLSLTEFEAAFQAASITNALPSIVAEAVSVVAVDAGQVYAAAMARPFQGTLLREALAKLDDDKRKRIREAVRIGFVEGQTTDQIIRRLRGTKAQQYKDGIWQTDRLNADAVVRTAIAHTANVARQKVFEANAALVREWQFLATLDARTSATCRGLSGKTFPIGKGPQPPRHYRCRSVAVPVLVSAWEALGLSRSDMPEGTQASMDGQVPADLNYNDWLKGKSAAFQDEVLGPTRAALFRKGGITMDRFVDRAGRELTLDQLREKYADAFERAGVTWGQ